MLGNNQDSLSYMLGSYMLGSWVYFHALIFNF